MSSVLAYLSLLPNRTLKRDESQRMNVSFYSQMRWTSCHNNNIPLQSFIMFLRQLDRSSKTFDKMQQLTPDLLYDLFNVRFLLRAK